MSLSFLSSLSFPPVAPAFSSVSGRASCLGAVSVSSRPSRRSFSGWVAVVSFGALSLARRFVRVCCLAFGLPFCAVRSSGSGGFSVSVPVSPPGGGGGGASPSPSPAPSSSGLPAPVASALFSAPAVGFSGSRSVVPSVLPSVLAGVPASSAPSVLVGCARGVDSAVRSFFGSSPVLSVFSVSGRGRGAFAARSAALVRAVAAASGCLFVFPGRACPSGVVPSRSFSGGGSGSWGSAALAVGLGVPVFLWLPSGVAAPSWLSPLGGGWFSSVPSGCQLSLFG